VETIAKRPHVIRNAKRDSRSNLDHATRRAFLAAHLSLQFLDLLFELNNDACKLIKTGANSFDRFSDGLV
jgi:hypothetical protein